MSSSSALLRYHPLSRLLHWLSAVVIVWATGSGFTLAFTDVSDAVRHAIADFNVAATLGFIPLFIVRMLLLLATDKPPTPGLASQQQRLATLGHCVLYGLISVVLVSGVLMMERPMSVFGIATLPQVFVASAITEGFFTLHRYSCMALAVMVLLHLAAVVRHHQTGIPVLKKML